MCDYGRHSHMATNNPHYNVGRGVGERPICIYCLQEIAVGTPRHWHGAGAYSHRDCYEALEPTRPQQDARRRP